MKSTKVRPKYGAVATRLQNSFDSVIRSRGRIYFLDEMVSQPVLTDRRAVMQVRGTEKYTIEIDWKKAFQDKQIILACNCPFYVEGKFCKHLWAGVLKLDHIGEGNRIPPAEGLVPLHIDSVSELSRAEESESADSSINNKTWLQRLQAIQTVEGGGRLPVIAGFRETGLKHAYFVLNLDETKSRGQLAVQFFEKPVSSTAGNSALSLRAGRFGSNDLNQFPDAVDREIISMLIGAGTQSPVQGFFSTNSSFSKAFIPPGLREILLQKLGQTGRFLRVQENLRKQKEFIALRYDTEELWSIVLQIKELHGHWATQVLLRNGDREVDGKEPLLILPDGALILWKDRIAKIADSKNLGWLMAYRSGKVPMVPVADADEFVEAMFTAKEIPETRWPENLAWAQEIGDPRPCAFFSYPAHDYASVTLQLDLAFEYGEQTAVFGNRQNLFSRKDKKILLRNLVKEEESANLLRGLRGPLEDRALPFPLRIRRTEFPGLVDKLLKLNWRVEAYGKTVRASQELDIKVQSGQDWFDLSGTAEFAGGHHLQLPMLLQALERGENLVPLGDGTLGLLPEEWLKRYAPLTGLATHTGDAFRFQKGKAFLLATWLGDDERVQCDADFSRLKKEIQRGLHLQPKLPASSFVGTLRPYQEVGLSWLQFLKRIEFGGILADDMGLGKTVQLLAHLDSEYAEMPKKDHLPTLIVLPKSLLFNWAEEAKRFAPKLNVLTYAGTQRTRLVQDLPKSDLVFVTYSTLRRDLREFEEQRFHYVVADEAQSIKNPESQVHQACLALQARYRLAMTGTPVENSADDLFAILNFVSPGLMSPKIAKKFSQTRTLEPQEENQPPQDNNGLQKLSIALKPFILRRTKDQVLSDLPEKSEQVLSCELSPPEKRRYDELRDYYRMHLAKEIEKKGFSQSKIIVLEALLRLRQAACHPGLIDKKRVHAESAKIETLLSQLKEVVSEGHKALVFSQFTSFLDIVEYFLNKEQISFERLDGQSSLQDRQDSVGRFQSESGNKVFLMSLKAGGVGLNLTAADYVFILDPWWNPAAESQAIDRAHRIGQKKKVFAYRLIARDTVEEKILQLQKSKREIAQALISEDSGMLRKLTASDLEILLS